MIYEIIIIITPTILKNIVCIAAKIKLLKQPIDWLALDFRAFTLEYKSQKDREWLWLVYNSSKFLSWVSGKSRARF